MKKKIRDLTINDCELVCKKNLVTKYGCGCNKCPLYMGHYCIKHLKELLEREVDFNE